MQNPKLLSRVLAATLLSLASVAAVHAADSSTTTGPLPPTTASAGQADDATITEKVKAALSEDKQLSASRINVTSEQGVVRISGAVPSAEVGQRALELAAGVKGVRDVKSELTVKAAS